MVGKGQRIHNRFPAVASDKPEVRLSDSGGNTAAVAFGYNLRMEVDLYTSGQLGREFLAGNTRTKGFPFLAGGDPCRRDRTGFVAVLYFRQVAEHSFLR